MPYVVNGFGTWNHGRANTVSVPDFCDKCGRFGFLSSYDTRTYVVALFLPVIPLGRKRILNHCAACNRWREMKLADWTKLRGGVLEDVARVLDNKINDAGAVANALKQLIGIQDAAVFETYAPRAVEAHEGDAGVMLALAQGYAYFGRLDDAERDFLAALAIEDTEAAHEGLAFALLQQNRATEAAPHLRHVLEQKQLEKSGLLYFLVEGLQAEGQHATAHALVETTLNAFPQLTKDKAWAKLRKTAQKNRASTKPIKRVTLSPKGGPKRDRSAALPKIAAVALVLVLAGVYFSVAIAEGRSRTVHVVNGLEWPYNVTIDEQAHYLTPGAVSTVTLGEGEHTIHAAELGLSPETISFGTNFFTRPFREEVVVINPDHVALVLKDETEYMVDVDDSARYDYVIHTNQPVYVFPNVHFAFEEFPDEIEMESNRAMRTRVSELEVDGESFAETLYMDLDEDEFLANLVQRFHYAPNNLYYAQNLAMFMETNAFFDEIRDALAVRPVHLELHRVYQNVADGPASEIDIQSQYADLLAAEPDSADLKYLAGRITRDREKALALYREASDAGNAYALGAIAGSGHLANGEFDEASQVIDAALAMMSDNPTLRHTRNLIWLAQGDVESFLAAVPQSRDGAPDDLSGLESMAVYGSARGDSDEQVRGIAERFILRSERDSGPLTPEQRSFVQDAVDYWYAFGSSRDAYLAKLDASEDAFDLWTAAAIRGDASKATELSEELELELPELQVLYLLATESGDTQVAQEYLTQIADEMAQARDWETRLVAAVLAGQEARSADELRTLGMIPGEKRMALALLAARFPDDKEQYLPLARKLNFEKVYPYYELDAYLERAGY